MVIKLLKIAQRQSGTASKHSGQTEGQMEGQMHMDRQTDKQTGNPKSYNSKDIHNHDETNL